MTSRFGCTAGTAIRKLYPKIPKNLNPDPELARDLYRYQKLYENVVHTMTDYTTLYTSGDFSTLKSKYNEAEINRLTAGTQNSNYYNDTIDKLIGFRYDSNTFALYQENILRSLRGLYLSMREHDNYIYANSLLNEKNAILTNKEMLIDYIQTVFTDKSNMEAFNISQSFNVTAVLKPWYGLYFEMYGPPTSGVFDAVKMAEVVNILIGRNEITLEEFTANMPKTSLS
jgi:hypothetical protein